MHLLEHTSGFDDRSLKESANNDPAPLALADGLAYRPETRTSRWRPGTHYSYSNCGPAIAAYIVEKTTGILFEKYVKDNWFKPMNMNDSEYFLTPDVSQKLTKLYEADGTTEIPYWHNIYRPSGALNASARDMAKLLKFFLTRGKPDGRTLLPASLIERMERPESSIASREGLNTGYSLCNYTSVKDGYIYHGHNGGMRGALSEFAYIPEAGAGYAFMINSENKNASERIDALIRSFITGDIKKPEIPGIPGSFSGESLNKYRGWYELINQRYEIFHFISRIIDMTYVYTDNGILVLKPLVGNSMRYSASYGNLFRLENAPVPTLALSSSEDDGKLVLTTRKSFKQISSILAWMEIIIVILFILFIISSIGIFTVNIISKLFNQNTNCTITGLAIFPFLNALSVILFCLILFSAGGDLFNRLGNISLWSVGLFITSALFAVIPVISLVRIYRTRKTESHFFWWYSLSASTVFSIAAIYLAYWGVIGIRTWM